MSTIAKKKNFNKIQYLTMRIANQMFGVPVLQVRDVFSIKNITPIPLTPPEISGAINLRGRIVTAVNMRCCLGVPSLKGAKQSMHIAIDYNGDLYSLIVDSVGDVISLSEEDLEQNAAIFGQEWKGFSSGVYKLSDELLVILNIDKVMDILYRARP